VTLDEIQKIVGTSYNIIKAFDLAILDTMSEKDIHNLLAPVCKSEFNEHDIIVFYCFLPLAHRFDDMPAESLIQLQKMLVYVDIPNFFCVTITNNKEMQSELDYVCNQHTTDETPIRTIVYNEGNYEL
jgi:hypothetical protein